MANKFEVIVNGRTFKRTSANRTYTHAILALRNITRACDEAHAWTAAEQQLAEENYQFHCDQADGSWWPKNGWVFRESDANDVAVRDEGRQIAAAGLEAYIASIKADKLARFDRVLAQGGFQWHVIAWAGSQRLADAQVRSNSRRSYYANVRAFPVNTGDNIVLAGETTTVTANS
jgi:hypothetical protein